MKKSIAVTGGIGSGKSTVLQYLKKKGYTVFSCDEIYREIIELPFYIEKIQAAFSSCVHEGKIDKAQLSKIVFSDTEALARLNAIAHPCIMQRLQEKMHSAEGYVFAEVPLLFEGNFEGLFDKVLVVIRNKEARIAAIMERDAQTREMALQKINAQFDYHSPLAKKRLENCQAIILHNEGDLKNIQQQIDGVLKQIKE